MRSTESNQPHLHFITSLPEGIVDLEAAAIGEGFRFLTRLIREWESGANRFDGPGECLMAAFVGERVVGIGGLTCDPFARPGIGRLRRLFVDGPCRGQHIGRSLVNQLVAHAAQHFSAVRLSTDTVSGAEFYAACGFRAVLDKHATHIKVFAAPSTAPPTR